MSENGQVRTVQIVGAKGEDGEFHPLNSIQGVDLSGVGAPRPRAFARAVTGACAKAKIGGDIQVIVIGAAPDGRDLVVN